jgi:hypothetical protein
MSEDEVDFIMDAIEFIAEYGYLFLAEYVLNIKTGAWSHKSYDKPLELLENFGIEESLKYIGKNDRETEKKENLKDEYKKYLDQARNHAARLKEKEINFKSFDEKECPSWFYFVNSK